jgi:hypothetical protein
MEHVSVVDYNKAGDARGGSSGPPYIGARAGQSN